MFNSEPRQRHQSFLSSDVVAERWGEHWVGTVEQYMPSRSYTNQVTLDVNHGKNWKGYQSSPFRPSDSGGPFKSIHESESFYIKGPPIIDGMLALRFNDSPTTWRDKFSPGPVILSRDADTLLRDYDISTPDGELDAWGTWAISQTAPNKPTVGLGVALGELLREGIPSMVGSALFKEKANYFKNLGSEYLNAQFGWAPFARDVVSTMHAVKKANQRFYQWQRDSGRFVRRRLELAPEEVWSVKTDHTGWRSIFSPAWGWTPTNWLPQGQFRDKWDVLTLTKTKWFSAQYQYYVPEGNDFFSNMARYESHANALLGIRLTPEVLWNLAPWTWLVDWFTNIGDIVAAVSRLNSDSMVLRYGYVMEESKLHRHTEANLRLVDGYAYNWYETNLTQDYVLTTKVRRAATPFGFEIDFGSLSEYQMSILGALGLSNMPRRRAFNRWT